MLKRTAFLFLFAATAFARDPHQFGEMRWRMIGPFRGGRTVAAVGVRQRPNVFYIGVNNGGVWESTDSRRLLSPIFDQRSTRPLRAMPAVPPGAHHHHT